MLYNLLSKLNDMFFDLSYFEINDSYNKKASQTYKFIFKYIICIFFLKNKLYKQPKRIYLISFKKYSKRK